VYYVLAQLTLTDRAAYKRYVDRFMPVLESSCGKVLAADMTPDLIEGSGTETRLFCRVLPIRLSFVIGGSRLSIAKSPSSG
jgi:uncharacterized protein (DUF1330 family)